MFPQKDEDKNIVRISCTPGKCGCTDPPYQAWAAASKIFTIKPGEADSVISIEISPLRITAAGPPGDPP